MMTKLCYYFYNYYNYNYYLLGLSSGVCVMMTPESDRDGRYHHHHHHHHRMADDADDKKGKVMKSMGEKRASGC